ncbi:MAG TPA: hypothetical protein VN229_05310 [Terriglobales bacterium]|nr:hypothetical protein [Terriglobales bacterium]
MICKLKLSLAGLLFLAACSSIGPGSVTRDRVDYANALSDSWKDQMLLNIVRLRYGDSPTFMDVSSVISAYTLQEAAQVGGTINVGSPNNTTTLPNGTGTIAVQGGYNDRPTISYTPLTGKKFAQSLLQPIPPSAIFSLIAAGYPVDVVLPVTVRALNGVYNRTSQGGTRRPADPQFYPLLDALRRIQLSRSFSIRIEKRGDEQTAIGVFAKKIDPQTQQDVDFVKSVLGLTIENGEMILAYGSLQRSPNELAVLSRSMIEIMQELSADIDVPAKDVADGRTYPTPTVPAQPSQYDMPRVRIDSGPNPPAGPFTAVSYRGTWYWVSDQDMKSKRSLTFLLLFFSLAETGVVPEAPVLTIPVQ